MILPPLYQLCPYCAAWPVEACASASYLLRYVHIGDREWDALYALDLVVRGLRSWALSMVPPPTREDVLLRTIRFESRVGAMDGCE